MSLLVALLGLAVQERAPEVLEASCVFCHHASRKKGGLDLSTREAILRGGENGPAVVLGDPERSLLYQVVSHRREPHMPHRQPKLSSERIELLGAWIRGGAPYSRPLVPPAAPKDAHWAFLPLGKGLLPAAGAAPPERERRRRLLRRVTFDLIGLPPSPAELLDFEKDASPDAWEKVVDRLLASPRYGERWGRHWLDLARYADSSGYESDLDRPTAYPYRDAVIQAFNQDLPFDTFLRWQLAGDLLAPDRPLALALTGFLTCGPASDTTPTDSRRNKEKYRMDEMDDVVSTLGLAFLGLSLGCARCHDHKYDPITSKEYYQMVAAFLSTRREERPLESARRRLEDWTEPLRRVLREDRLRALPIAEAHREILRQPLSVNNALSASLYKAHGEALKISDRELRKSLSLPARAAWDALDRAWPGGGVRTLAVAEGAPAVAYWLERGDVDRKKEVVHPGVPAALGRRGSLEGPARVALGLWMTDVREGAGALAARVWVNRVWGHHFGEGIVGTPNDFGAQGDRPTRPELLEGLAWELVHGGWRLKSLHRRILLSAEYLAPRPRPVRLEAEAIRDAMLALSGRLNPAIGGPAVKLRVPPEAISTRSKDEYPRNVGEGPATWRRSVYVFTKRSVLVPFMDVYDAPSASASCGRRPTTTLATQAITLLNDPFVRGCAKDFARRVGEDRERAFLEALGRLPRESERRELESYPGSMTDCCHVLFMLSEFIYVD
jgi:hypothetical protein